MGERRRLGRSIAAAIGLCLLLGACARPVGDFERAEPSYVNDTVMPAVGTVRAALMGEPVSGFNRADEETLMADRIWRFMVASHAHDWFYDVAAELKRTRIATSSGAEFKVDRYYNWLHSTAYRSASVRYATVLDDVRADIGTLPDTFAAICAVEEIERERAVSASQIAGIGLRAEPDTAARKSENHVQIGMFVHALRYRYDSYNFALDHLLVETPHQEARDVDAALHQLEGPVQSAERGDFCRSLDIYGGGRGEGAIPSRLSRPMGSAPDPDLAKHAS